MENIELELAIKIITDTCESINQKEEIRIEDARGRILYDDIFAPINQPPFDRSPLDGYAIKSKDTKGSSKEKPIKLKVIDEVFAGGYSTKILNDKEAVRIMTGAKLPLGSDCVIRQENTNYNMEHVEIYQELNAYDNYCFEGEDIKKGSKLIDKDEKLNYIHIGILASMGYKSIYVRRKPKIAIMSTGDELMSLGDTLKEGKIYDSNRRLISARLLDYGCEIIETSILEDNTYTISDKIGKIIDSVDLVITTGGVSVGKKDMINDVINKLGGKRLFWRINIKPGTPVLFATYKNKPLLCLSGNPFAALATFELLGKELIYKLTKDKNLETVRVSTVMESEFLKSSPTRRIIRGIYKNNRVYLPKGHSSGMLGSMIGCNCLVDIKAGTNKLQKGDKVEIILLS